MTYHTLSMTMMGTTEYLRQRPLPDRLAELGKPVLVIFGEDDRRWRSSSAADRRAAPGLRRGPRHAGGLSGAACLGRAERAACLGRAARRGAMPPGQRVRLRLGGAGAHEARMRSASYDGVPGSAVSTMRRCPEPSGLLHVSQSRVSSPASGCR